METYKLNNICMLFFSGIELLSITYVHGVKTIEVYPINKLVVGPKVSLAKPNCQQNKYMLEGGEAISLRA